MATLTPERDQVTGCVLAGGQARRMGGINKALYEHQGQPLFQYAVSNLNSCCDEVVINAHRDQAIFKQAGFIVIEDGEFAGLGPIAGIHAALAYAVTPFIAIAACDQLDLPEHVYPELYRAATTERGAYACSQGDRIPTCAIVPVSLLEVTRHALEQAKSCSGSSGQSATNSISDSRKSLALIPFMQAFARPVEFDDIDFHNVNSQGPQASS